MNVIRKLDVCLMIVGVRNERTKNKSTNAFEKYNYTVAYISIIIPFVIA